MNARTLQDASTLMAVAAATLAQTQGKPLDAGAAAQLLLNTAVAAGPAAINPNLGLALSLGAAALSAIHVAQSAGQGITAEQLKALFVTDDEAKAADAAAQAAAAAAAPAVQTAAIAPTPALG